MLACRVTTDVDLDLAATSPNLATHNYLPDLVCEKKKHVRKTNTKNAANKIISSAKRASRAFDGDFLAAFL